jgi:hypothetical protein
MCACVPHDIFLCEYVCVHFIFFIFYFLFSIFYFNAQDTEPPAVNSTTGALLGPQPKFPSYSRVNHAKYVVTDRRANIGTSNHEVSRHNHHKNKKTQRVSVCVRGCLLANFSSCH